jgi:hypothetical protein
MIEADSQNKHWVSCLILYFLNIEKLLLIIKKDLLREILHFDIWDWRT